MVVSGDVDWQSADVVCWQCLRLVCSNRPGTWGPCRADIGALLLPVCNGRVLGRQASATRHATRVTGYIHTIGYSIEIHICSVKLNRIGINLHVQFISLRVKALNEISSRSLVDSISLNVFLLCKVYYAQLYNEIIR